jgi:hypothetical protein
MNAQTHKANQNPTSVDFFNQAASSRKMAQQMQDDFFKKVHIVAAKHALKVAHNLRIEFLKDLVLNSWYAGEISNEECEAEFAALNARKW